MGHRLMSRRATTSRRSSRGASSFRPRCWLRRRARLCQVLGSPWRRYVCLCRSKASCCCGFRFDFWGNNAGPGRALVRGPLCGSRWGGRVRPVHALGLRFRVCFSVPAGCLLNGLMFSNASLQGNDMHRQVFCRRSVVLVLPWRNSVIVHYGLSQGFAIRGGSNRPRGWPVTQCGRFEPW